MITAPETLHAELITLFASVLQVEVPAADTDLIATGRLDSIGMVALLLNLERRYGITVDMRELSIDNFRSVSAIAAYVATRHRNGSGEGGKKPPGTGRAE